MLAHFFDSREQITHLCPKLGEEEVVVVDHVFTKLREANTNTFTIGNTALMVICHFTRHAKIQLNGSHVYNIRTIYHFITYPT